MSARQRKTRTIETSAEPAAAPAPANMPGIPAVAGLVRGLIVELLADGQIEVVVLPDVETRVRCDFLHTGNAPVLAPGDTVLLMPPPGPGQNGCVLGRVGPYVPPGQHADAPRQVVVEAQDQLTLKCGDSTIELRKDGKLLVRGNDIVSRARRTNRIKGGSVAIN